MTIQKILVPDMGDFKNVEIIEVLVKEGQKIKKEIDEHLQHKTLIKNLICHPYTV